MSPRFPGAASASPLIEVHQRRLRIRRDVRLLQSGLLRVAQETEVRGRQRTMEVSGPFCVFGFVRILRGAVRYRVDQQTVVPRGRWFGMFLPPFSIVEVDLVASHTFSLGFLVRDLPPSVPAEPVIFPLASRRLPAGHEDLVRLLAKARRLQAIARQARPSPAASHLKQAIDRLHAQPLSLQSMIRSLGRAPAAASRSFRQAYGLTPSRYRQSLRVLDSLLRLAEGQPIVDVAGEVGFGDLSRFYRHFRRIACSPPGRYLPRRSKNAKTRAR